MNDDNQKLYEQMIDKSIDAFVLGIEIYNKPTIKYRIESFSFLVINAWELLLKAELIKRGKSIYYKKKGQITERTLSFEDSLKRIYSDSYTRTRKNLEKILELRNISTHFITQEYEYKYAPLFQACVMNYVIELKRFHDKDITNYMSQHFLQLSANHSSFVEDEYRVKYAPEVLEKMIQQFNDIDVLIDQYNSEAFAIPIKHTLYFEKDKNKADFIVSIDRTSSNKIMPVKELKDPANTHKFSFKNVVVVVTEYLRKHNINLGYPKGFNTAVLTWFIDFYSIKDEPKYTYEHHVGDRLIGCSYSQALIDFIIDEIKKNPDKFVDGIKPNKKR